MAGLKQMIADRKSPPRDAVDDACFTCRPGRVFCLLGANGAGKTTTLRMIATMLSISAGAIEVDGFSVATDAKEVRRRLGFLTGSTKLYHRLTARELVRYYARLHGVNQAAHRRREDRLFALLDMRDFADKRIAALSTGMKQKVSIARAVIHDPTVLVLDEATAGLDALASRGIVELIRSQRESGKTVLFSTHRLNEVVELADDLAVIHKGRILYSGTLSDFRAGAEDDSFERAFIGLIENAES